MMLGREYKLDIGRQHVQLHEGGLHIHRTAASP